MLRYNKPLILKTDSSQPTNQKNKSKLNKLDYDTVKTLAAEEHSKPSIGTLPQRKSNRRLPKSK